MPYTDNYDAINKAYFVPTRTVQEWLAFKVSTISGDLRTKLLIAYGCESNRLNTDQCGCRVLPFAKHSKCRDMCIAGLDTQ